MISRNTYFSLMELGTGETSFPNDVWQNVSMAAAGPPCRPPPRCCRWQCALGEAPNFPPTLNPVSGAVFADAHSGGSVLPGLLSAPSTLVVLANFYFLFHICKHVWKTCQMREISFSLAWFDDIFLIVCDCQKIVKFVKSTTVTKQVSPGL